MPERELEAGSSSDPELEVMSLASPVRSMTFRLAPTSSLEEADRKTGSITSTSLDLGSSGTNGDAVVSVGSGSGQISS